MRAWMLQLVFLFSCGGGNSLTGSITEVYPDLSFTTVNIYQQDSDLVLEYRQGADGMGGWAAKLAIYTADLTIQAHNSIDLPGAVGNSKRATLYRIIEGSVELGIQTGTIVFDAPPTPGKTTSGHFNITTADPAGRTLNGNFQGTVGSQ
jgi:hypothetical protein